MSIRSYAGDTHIVDIDEAHIKVFGDVVIGAAWDETEFVVLEVDSYSIGVETVVFFSDEIQLGSYVKVFKSLAAVPVTESGDVEIVKVFVYCLLFA